MSRQLPMPLTLRRRSRLRPSQQECRALQAQMAWQPTASQCTRHRLRRRRPRPQRRKRRLVSASRQSRRRASRTRPPRPHLPRALRLASSKTPEEIAFAHSCSGWQAGIGQTPSGRAGGVVRSRIQVQRGQDHSVFKNAGQADCGHKRIQRHIQEGRRRICGIENCRSQATCNSRIDWSASARRRQDNLDARGG